MTRLILAAWRWWTPRRCIIGLVILFALDLLLFGRAGAQDAEHMREYHADVQMDQWMRSLKRPGSGYSCCNERDCAKTDAEWKGGQWWADFKGTLVPVPPEKELDVLSFDGAAYLCAKPDSPVTAPKILCFVKPGSGS